MQKLPRLFFLREIVALPQLKWEKFTEAYQQTKVKEMTEMGGLSILQTSNVTDPGTSWHVNAENRYRQGYLRGAQEALHRLPSDCKEGNPHFWWKDLASPHNQMMTQQRAQPDRTLNIPDWGICPKHQHECNQVFKPLASSWPQIKGSKKPQGNKRTNPDRFYKTTALVSSKHQCQSGEGREKVPVGSCLKLRD